MPKLTRDELFEKAKSILGDNVGDDALSFLEDLADTLTEPDTRRETDEDWQRKYDELDKSWRQRYRDRFFGKADSKEDEDSVYKADEDEKTESVEISIDDLFEEREDK